MAGQLTVNVVASDDEVWKGDALSVIVRTTEGDLGIWPGHEPLMAILVPHAAQIQEVNGERLVLAIDSGFVSVFENHVSIISAYGELATTISVKDAELEVANLHDVVDSGEATEAQLREYHRYQAQVAAGHKHAEIHK